MTKSFEKKLIKSFFTPAINSLDLIMFGLILLIFSSLFVQLIMFFVYYLFVSKPLVKNFDLGGV